MGKDVVEMCLAFCQALTSSNNLFSLSLKIGNDAFNLDLKESGQKLLYRVTFLTGPTQQQKSN